MNARMIELVFFDGCPDAAQAREDTTVLVDGHDVTGEAAPREAVSGEAR